MSSTGKDWGDILSRLNVSWSVKEIAKIMSIINKRTTPVEEDESLIKHVVFSPLIDLHTNANTDLATDINLFDKTIDQDGYSGPAGTPPSTPPPIGTCGWGMRKLIPDNVRVYDLTHDNSNAGGITFPPPGNYQIDKTTTATSNGVRHMGGGFTDGASYMVINNHSWLNVTDSLMISGWAYLKTADATGDIVLRKGSTDAWDITIPSTTSTFRCVARMSGGNATLDYTFTPNTWFQFLFQMKDGSQELWINNSLVASNTRSGTITTNTNDLGIWATSAGANKLQSGCGLSWLSLANGFGDATWVSDYFTKGQLNYDTDAGQPEEITTIPFIGSVQEMPNSFCGMFIAT